MSITNSKTQRFSDVFGLLSQKYMKFWNILVYKHTKILELLWHNSMKQKRRDYFYKHDSHNNNFQVNDLNWVQIHDWLGSSCQVIAIRWMNRAHI